MSISYFGYFLVWDIFLFDMQNINIERGRVKGAWDLPVHFFATSYKSIIFSKKKVKITLFSLFYLLLSLVFVPGPS